MVDSATPPTTNPLDGIRVLDLTTARAEMAGKVLADLGAEVIKVEPPGGTAARQMPPFDNRDPTRSLYWAALGLGKRSVVLDVLGDEGDRDALHRLLVGADVLLESHDPGVMASIGLGYADLAKRYPQLIYTSVTPYGQDGPWADRPSTELTAEAAGGLVSLQGDGDRAPIPVGYAQAAFHAGVTGRRRHGDRAQRTRPLRTGSAPRCLAAGGDRLDADERHGLPSEPGDGPTRTRR